MEGPGALCFLSAKDKSRRQKGSLHSIALDTGCRQLGRAEALTEDVEGFPFWVMEACKIKCRQWNHSVKLLKIQRCRPERVMGFTFEHVKSTPIAATGRETAEQM